MNLKETLYAKKDQIFDKGFEAIIDTYPPETAKFLKDKKSRFSNPVGQAIKDGAEAVLDELFRQREKDEGFDYGRVGPFLDTVIRVRAIQEFTPLDAVSFVFRLKGIIREAAGEGLTDAPLWDELLAVYSDIDGLALFCFDTYARCREKVHELRAEEVKRSTFRLLQQANLITGGQEESGPGEGSSN